MSTNATIYTGIWTNYSKGIVTGATLTLPVRDGIILISVLALFIQLAGGQSWSIISFIAHQIRATPQARDGLYHQQQAILRNGSSDMGDVWRLGKLVWAWRTQKINGPRKSLVLILTGVLHLLAFGAAGILSSHITTLNNEVLLGRSQSCGFWMEPASTDSEASFADVVANTVFAQNAIQSSNQYVQNCLKQGNTLPECNQFKQHQLNWTSTSSFQCPFENGMCLGPTDSSLHFDTGLINSRDDLGVNSDDKNLVNYRKTATCIPITTEGYVISSNVTTPYNSTFSATAAYYGPNMELPSNATLDIVLRIENATYITSNFRDFQFSYDAMSLSPYRTYATVAYPSMPIVGFSAIPELYSSDSSVTLIFAGYSGQYLGPSDDLWLPAHQASSIGYIFKDSTTPQTIYETDNVINVLACTEQHQFCNPNISPDESLACTPLQSIDELSNGMFKPGTNESMFSNQTLQNTVAQIILNGAYSSSWNFIASNPGIPLLASNLAIGGGVSLPLPNNQWVLETENWFAISLASIQRYVVDIATGPPGDDAQYTNGQASNDTSMQQFCSNQVIQRQDYTNFSVLAITLIFVLGGAITCVSWFIAPLVGYFQLRFKRGEYRQICWQLDSTLQLQRMAYEEAGLGTWKGGADDVPVTEKGDKFAIAKGWDEKHPSIRGKLVQGGESPREGRISVGGSSISENSIPKTPKIMIISHASPVSGGD